MADVIYSFHFYEPMTFTHQGATWVGPIARVLSGVPYPSTPALVSPLLKRIRLPAARRALAAYGRQRWNADHIRLQIARAAAWARSNRVPLVDGEFGVYRPYAPPSARYRWLRDVRTALEHDHIGWAMWNFDSGFNLVSYRYPGVLSGPDVDGKLLAAIGLRHVEPAALPSPITRFDRGTAGRIVLPIAWLGRLWVAGHGHGSATLASAAGPGAPRRLGLVARITHQGDRLWTIYPNVSFPVTSGQRYRLASWAERVGPGSCALDLVEYAPDGQTMNRAALAVTARGRWQQLRGSFTIPRRAARIAFRWTGHGRSTAEVSAITLSRLSP